MCRYVVHTRFAGSVTDLLMYSQTNGIASALALYETPSLDSWMVLIVFGLVEAILQLYLPGKIVHGPVTPKGNIPVYKANGVQAYFTTLVLFGLGWWFDVFSPAQICDLFGKLLASLNLFAFGLCIMLYFKVRIYLFLLSHWNEF